MNSKQVSFVFDLQRFADTTFNIATGNTVLSSSGNISASIDASKVTSGTLAIARGGTGQTVNPSMLTNLAVTTAANVFAASPRPGVTGTLGIANGGTGQTTAAAARNALGLGNTTGALPVANGGTGATVLSAITVGKASSLATARNLKVSLASANAQSFQGTGDATQIGVGGVLPVANGGTGQTVLTSVTVGKANSLTTARALQVSLSNTNSVTFNGTADVKTIGVQGVLPVANGGTGQTNLNNVKVGEARMLRSNVLADGMYGNSLDPYPIIYTRMRNEWGGLFISLGDDTTSSTEGAYLDISTGDDGAEAIYVSQYKGGLSSMPTDGALTQTNVNAVLTTRQRRATLLGTTGNTGFPGTVTAAAFSGPLTGNVTGNVSGSSGSCTGNAATATKASSLSSARALQVSLSNTAAANFQGNADVKTIGVQGVLSIAHGGTGQTTAALARNALGLGNTTGALPVANGGTGQTLLANVTVGAATKATQDGSGKTIATTYAPLALSASQNAAHYIPFAGNSNLTSGNIQNFQSLKSGLYTETLSANVPETSGSASWYNVISVRHRNGGTDGTKYGMLLFSRMDTADGNLYWQKQRSGAWQNSKTVIDSSNIGSQAAGSAAKFTSAQTVALTGDVTGSVSSQAGWTVNVIRRSCSVGTNTTANSLPWYKVCSATFTGGSQDRVITMLVHHQSASNLFGILRVYGRREASAWSTGCRAEWMLNYGFTLSDFVIVKSTDLTTLELWVKIEATAQRRLFTVLSESDNNNFGQFWTFYPALSAGQKASIDTEGTQTQSVMSSYVIRNQQLPSYCVCSTAAATVAKTATCDNFHQLIAGVHVTVKFTVTNTAKNPTLNINSTGAKAIYYRGTNIVPEAIQANTTLDLVYNGTQYDVVGSLVWTTSTPEQ